MYVQQSYPNFYTQTISIADAINNIMVMICKQYEWEFVNIIFKNLFVYIYGKYNLHITNLWYEPLWYSWDINVTKGRLKKKVKKMPTSQRDGCVQGYPFRFCPVTGVSRDI